MKSSRKRHKKERPPLPNALVDEQRLFVAVPVPEDVKSLMKNILERLRALEQDIRWVDPESAHITLHFLGPTPPENAELVKMILAEPARELQPFQLVTTGIGAFPNSRKPTVLWLGVEGDSSAWQSLYEHVGKRLEELGFEIELRPSVPHLTLGRVRGTPGADFRRRFDSTFNNAKLDRFVANASISFPVDRFQLVQSHLEKTGPRYEIRETYRLG